MSISLPATDDTEFQNIHAHPDFSHRATSRTNIPQVNLKDRIAALQQRNASAPQPGLEPGVTTTTSVPGRIALPGASSLRDKIANFEKKGAVPVPRGRFGESAPASGEAALKKRGELYGNRVPELAKSTGEAALLVRKRTVSSHTARSYSISKPLVPTLTGNTPPLPPLQPQFTGDWAGFSAARYPSTFDPLDRRAVSDVLPHTPAFSDFRVEEPLMEGEVEEKVEENDVNIASVGVSEARHIVSAPSQVLREDSIVVTESESLPTPTTVASPPDEVISEVLQSEDAVPEQRPEVLLAPPTEDVLAQVTQPYSPLAESEAHDVTPTQPEPQVELDESASVQTITFPTAQSPSVTTPTDDVSPPPSAPLSLNTDTSGSSGTEDISAGSEELHTPSDNMSFQTAESPLDAKAVEEPLTPDVSDAVFVTEPPQVVSAAVAHTFLVPASSQPSPTLTETPVPVVTIESPVDRATDLPDSPLTAKPKPAPIVAPPPQPTAPIPAPSSPTENAMLERRTARKSFHAVVHHKVVESIPAEPAPPVPAAASAARLLRKKTNPSFPAQKSTPRRVVSQAYVEPDSPSLSDLAGLVADAALLEEALASPAAAKKSSRAPARAPPGPPAARQSRSLERPRPAEIRVQDAQGSTISPPEDSPYNDQKTAANSASFFTSHLRAAPSANRQSTSPASSNQVPKYFSGLRVRKQSMPGAYPRSSMASEMSVDDSAASSTPPSPPLHGHDGSDTSSIRSSSKSWKSSKKSLGRASSWLFRKRSPSVAGE